MPRLVTLIALFGFLVFGIFLYYHKSPIQIDDFDPNFACHDVEKETIAKLAVLSSFRIVDKSQMQKFRLDKPPDYTKIKVYKLPSGSKYYESDIKITRQKYTQKSFKSFARAIRRNEKKGNYSGIAQSPFRYSWDKNAFTIFSSQNAKSYKVKSSHMQVYVEPKIKLMDWNYPEKTDDKDVNFYKKLLCYVRQHEMQHINISRSVIYKGLEDIKYLKAGTKKELAQKLHDHWSFVSDEMLRLNSEYDRADRKNAFH